MKNMILGVVLLFCLSHLCAQDRYAVVITEVFPDPTPSVGLPGYEWVEIKNVSATPLNLQGWRLGDANAQSGAFPVFTLLPDSMVIVCGSSALAALAAYGPAFSVSSFPSLDNDGDQLHIRSVTGKIIHAVKYESGWYGNELKAQGGWSLEIIDPGNPCMGKSNWRASVDLSGGTPGKRNSVDALTADEDIPRLLRTYVSDSLTIQLVFDETLDSSSGAFLSNYDMPGGPALLSAVCKPPLFNEVQLKLSSAMERGRIYQVSAILVRDCAGNTMRDTEIKTGLPELPLPGAWIINEILFNPRPNGYDYVEFFNAGKTILDLTQLFIASRDGNGTLVSIKPIRDLPWLIFPGEYVVITENASSLSHQYLVSSPGQVMEMGSLPSLPDDEGVVVALDSRGFITDEVRYDKSWHFKLVNNPEGISLERISPSGFSQDPMNWHSASSTAGYGTPGYKNSQFLPPGETTSGLKLEPGIFSPDNDGRDDILFLRYEMTTPGQMASVYIFDIHGRLVRHLVNNTLLGMAGHWKWDGLDDKGMKLPASLYVVYVELFDLTGKKLIFKEAVALARP